MTYDRNDARRVTRASRLSFGDHLKVRGEAANIVAAGLLCGIVLSGTTLIVLASGVTAALALLARGRARPLEIPPAPDARELLPTLRTQPASFPRP